MKKVATIIVTYNGAKWIQKCVQHLIESTFKSTIILIDNNSTDNTVDLLKPFEKDILFMQMNKNLGFGAANNLGIKKAIELEVDYVFLLNQDAYVSKNCIDNLISVAEQSSDFGVLSPLQFAVEGKELDVTFKNQMSRDIKNLPQCHFNDAKKEIGNEQPKEVRFVGAAAWFLPIEMIKKVGFFHPVFYHYGEDNNYAARVQYWGYKIGIVTESSVIHDRVQRKDPKKFLPVKLRTFPLHLLLDVRKSFIISWLLGFYQLIRIRKKLRKAFGSTYELDYEENKNWFLHKASEVRQIRKSFKTPFRLE